MIQCRLCLIVWFSVSQVCALRKDIHAVRQTLKNVADDHMRQLQYARTGEHLASRASTHIQTDLDRMSVELKLKRVGLKVKQELLEKEALLLDLKRKEHELQKTLGTMLAVEAAEVDTSAGEMQIQGLSSARKSVRQTDFQAAAVSAEAPGAPMKSPEVMKAMLPAAKHFNGSLLEKPTLVEQQHHEGNQTPPHHSHQSFLGFDLDQLSFMSPREIQTGAMIVLVLFAFALLGAIVLVTADELPSADWDSGEED